MCTKFRDSRIGYSGWVHYFCMCMWLCVFTLCKFVWPVVCLLMRSFCMRACVFRESMPISLVPSVYWQILDRPQWAARASLSHAAMGRHRSQDMHGQHTHTQRCPAGIFKRVWRQRVIILLNFEAQLFKMSTPDLKWIKQHLILLSYTLMHSRNFSAFIVLEITP